jgi:hypothetical protein
MGAIRANDFPRQADGYGQAADDHTRSRTDPNDAERRTGPTDLKATTVLRSPSKEGESRPGQDQTPPGSRGLLTRCLDLCPADRWDTQEGGQPAWERGPRAVMRWGWVREHGCGERAG